MMMFRLCSSFLLLYLLTWASTIEAATKKKKSTKKKKKKAVTMTRELTNLCKRQDPIKGKKMEQKVKWMVEASGEASILLKTSPQHLGACWMLYKDKQSKNRGQSPFLQRYSLAVLHFATTKSNTTAWDWPMAVDDPKAIPKHGDWLHTSKHECSWYGVTCWGSTIYELNLGYMKLDGLIPRELYLLKGLKDIDLHANDFQGVVPHKFINAMTQLQHLRLQMNGFFGAIQKEIVKMKELKELNLFGNYFGGTIPTQLAKLTKLEHIDIYANQLEGTIPKELAKLKRLKFLDLHDNNLTGTVPKEICAMKLDELVVDCLGPKPEVKCDCCTICCRGLPDFRCIDMVTKTEIVFGKPEKALLESK